ncbi:MAG: hypothetical protein H6865_02880 [Rhodospirillales bacterium]|nr:hypothetical protein [Alphaproteobacteria bacterium]MCB9986561.1 hypothetical protein [Rhodospirillales bacterium]USO06906.1 MAG: hypothetical protein H6866_05505 [Rhodospirillales bacterium]
MSLPIRRLSEQDLAQLYLQTEAPLRLDDLMQDRVHGDAAQIAVHDSIAAQTPDLALISLSLCALIVARDFPVELKDGPGGPVLRELTVACEDNLLTVGRLWLDTVCNGIKPARSDRDVIATIPDRLRILTSIFMELRDMLLETAPGPIHAALKTLYYQSESHADLADRFVADFARPRKTAKPSADHAAARRKTPVQVPLPFDLIRPREGAEVVSFSLFHQKRRP